MTTESTSSYRIVLLGAGQVAWHLGPALEQAGHVVEAVYSRHPAHAAELAARLGQATVHPSLDFSEVASRVFVVAIADQALPWVLAAANFPEGSLVVHTSGNQPLTLIQEAQPTVRAGVLYPLQTFSKIKPVDFRTVPMCVEGDDEGVTELLVQLAEELSDQVLRVTSEERGRLHVSAVFACNFTNHLLGISFELMRQSKLPGAILNKLIRETFEKALAFPPFTVQTGPAVRGDEGVLDHHLDLLADFPAYQDLYRLLSESILRQRAGEQGTALATP